MPILAGEERISLAGAPVVQENTNSIYVSSSLTVRGGIPRCPDLPRDELREEGGEGAGLLMVICNLLRS